MASRQYGDFVVHGGSVHAGDTILHLNITNDLTETASLCRIIDSALAGFPNPPTYLQDTRNDVEELLNTISTLGLCIEDSVNEFSLSPIIQSNLLDLWTAFNTHRQTLFDMKIAVEELSRISSPDFAQPSNVQHARLRSAVRGLRKRLNTLIAILHLSTVQSLRLNSAEQWSRLRRQIENIQDQLENQASQKLPVALPLAKQHLSRLSNAADASYPLQRLLCTDTRSIMSNCPSMQISTIRSSMSGGTDTYVSAAEYRSHATSQAGSFFSTLSRTIKPLRKFLFERQRVPAPPEVTIFQAEIEVPSAIQTQLITYNLNKGLHKPVSATHGLWTARLSARDALNAVRGLLADHRVMCQRNSERQFFDKVVRTAGVTMLQLFELAQGSEVVADHRIQPKLQMRRLGIKILEPQLASGNDLVLSTQVKSFKSSQHKDRIHYSSRFSSILSLDPSDSQRIAELNGYINFPRFRIFEIHYLESESASEGHPTT